MYISNYKGEKSDDEVDQYMDDPKQGIIMITKIKIINRQKKKKKIKKNINFKLLK